MARPMRALVIRVRACSVLFLSPPEVIHSIPPITRKAKTRIPAIMKATEIAFDIRVPTSVICIPDGWGTPRLSVAAKTLGIKDIFFEFNNLVNYKT